LSDWPSVKARVALRALQRIGWKISSQKGSHVKLQHPQRGTYMFGFHDKEELGPKILSKIAKYTGLKPEDL
jgi:predicted RNA binding protein YcfA (HicA-like mRNA interferase family)